MTLTYQTSNFQGLLDHGWQRQMFVRDMLEDRRTELAAQVRSGDYFITLATNLERICQKMSDNPERAGLQNLIADLLYLQVKYKISQHDGRR
ncbi:MAG TPA: hypothetical protein VH144_01825 [Candidatus Saccharimonadales bacterium]|jgi:hypothetical protein|nr:hypothetical protein [Candidatus Saccharimonadales bacterium]